jgi:hypothetical protein
MTLTLLAVTKKVTVQLLEMVLSKMNVLKSLENHLHRMGITYGFLLIVTSKFCEFLDFVVSQFAAVNSGRRTNALNSSGIP